MLYGVESLTVKEMKPNPDPVAAWYISSHFVTDYLATIELELKSFSVPADRKSIEVAIPFAIVNTSIGKAAAVCIRNLKTEVDIESHSLELKSKKAIEEKIEESVFSLIA